MDKQQRGKRGRVVRGARNPGEGEAYTAPRTRRLHARTRANMHAVVTDRVPSSSRRPPDPSVCTSGFSYGWYVRSALCDDCRWKRWHIFPAFTPSVARGSSIHASSPRLVPPFLRPWPREDPRTDARAFYLASGAISPRSSTSSAPSSAAFPLSPLLDISPLFPRLVKPFDGSSSLSFFFQVIRSRRSDRSSFARGNPRVSILELRNGKYIDAYRGFPSRSKYRSETAFGSIYGSVRWKISGTFSPSE